MVNVSHTIAPNTLNSKLTIYRRRNSAVYGAEMAGRVLGLCARSDGPLHPALHSRHPA
jgi:hypothetical protein